MSEPAPLPGDDGQQRLRRLALTLFREALAGCDPAAAVRSSLHARDDRVLLGSPESTPRRVRCRRAVLLAVGKAACPMAASAREVLAGGVESVTGIALAPHGAARRVPGITVRGAGHPVPDVAGLRAAGELAAMARAAGRDDLVLALISGGGSALAPLPAPGITLADKVCVTQMLLAAGADIDEMNAVRRHLSVLKGGGLARLAWPAPVHALLVSDVVGDDPAVIASGPTVPDPSTFADALAVLERHGLLDAAPAAVVRHLRDGIRGRVPETPKPGDARMARAGWHIVASGSGAIRRMAQAAARQRAGVATRSEPVTGEARAAGARLAGQAAAGANTAPLQVMLSHGETTVVVRGAGSGGRNQELALAFALAAEELPMPRRWAFLSAGTDGIDGPTDAAGALVDGGTMSRIRAGGGDPRTLLGDNDSYRALRLANDLLHTGPTGTNVADVQIFVSAT